MDYLIRFAQVHENFRQAEIEALTSLAGTKVEIVSYSQTSPFCLVRFPDISGGRDDLAQRFISRSILSRGIYELWGQGTTYDELHKEVRDNDRHLQHCYRQSPFKFSIDAYCGKRSILEQREIINKFRYLGLKGKISLSDPDVEFVIFEEWDQRDSPHHRTVDNKVRDNPEDEHSLLWAPKKIFLGRRVGSSSRHLIEKHDLKQRPYISTTSMDAELALVTANLALAAGGKFFLDPFVGTGGFLVAAAEFGSMTLGADIDGRSFRGKGPGLESGVGANFGHYGLTHLFMDCITSDLVNTPFRSLGQCVPRNESFRADSTFGTTSNQPSERWLDGIICDPPYGVREGLKVLGTRKAGALPGTPVPVHFIDGLPSYAVKGYIAPKKPYSFVKMLDDILDFAARTLRDRGRLAFWMPTANDEEEIGIPQHEALHLEHCCVQPFNKWSRRLLVYSRKCDSKWDGSNQRDIQNAINGTRADDLNPFRRKYFNSFQAP